MARLRAGEATSLVLLTATALGLASCPVTEPLEIPETRDAVQTDVFGDSGFPQMLLRIGWAPVNADPLPRTPRRPVEEVVEWLDLAGTEVCPRSHRLRRFGYSGTYRRRTMITTMKWTDWAP